MRGACGQARARRAAAGSAQPGLFGQLADEVERRIAGAEGRERHAGVALFHGSDQPPPLQAPVDAGPVSAQRTLLGRRQRPHGGDGRRRNRADARRSSSLCSLLSDPRPLDRDVAGGAADQEARAEREGAGVRTRSPRPGASPLGSARRARPGMLRRIIGFDEAEVERAGAEIAEQEAGEGPAGVRSADRVANSARRAAGVRISASAMKSASPACACKAPRRPSRM